MRQQRAMRAREPRARARVGAGRSSGAVIRLAGTAAPWTSVAEEQSPSAIRRLYRRPTAALRVGGRRQHAAEQQQHVRVEDQRRVHQAGRVVTAPRLAATSAPRGGPSLAVTLSAASVPLESARRAPAEVGARNDVAPDSWPAAVDAGVQGACQKYHERRRCVLVELCAS